MTHELFPKNFDHSDAPKNSCTPQGARISDSLPLQGLEHVQNLIRHSDVAAVLIVSPTDLCYVTGLSISKGTLLITSEKAVLFIDPRYRIAAETLPSECDVVCHLDPSKMRASIGKALKGISGHVGFDSSTMTVDRFQDLSSYASPSQLIPVPSLFSNLRRPKSSDEITAIEEACKLCERGFLFLVEQIHEGVTEQQLSQALKTFWFTHDAEALSFEPIIAFGPNSACPHWTSSATRLTAPSPILIDIGVKRHGYHSDMTRTLFFGPPDPELFICHALVQEAYTLAFSLARPGVSPFSLDAAARQFLTDKGYGNAFVHGLGHGVGREVHEPPRLSAFSKDEGSLEKGDVITIEPGIYIPGRGGVRIENTVVIEESSARSLFSVPIQPMILAVG
jgi:Xaa-Pro aminopeptidase